MIPYYKKTKEYKENKAMFDFYSSNIKYIKKFLSGTKDSDFYTWVIFKEDLTRKFVASYNKYIAVKEADNIDNYKIKSLVQNDYKFGLDFCKRSSLNEYKEARRKLFDYLDSKKEPYKHIFYPYYALKTIMSEKGFYPYKKAGGVNEETLLIASEYAKYKLNDSKA